MFDLVARRIAAHDQRQQCKCGAGYGHQDRDQPFLGATQDQCASEHFAFLFFQMAEMADHHDGVAGSNAEDGHESDQRTERHDAARQRDRDYTTDQRKRQAECDQPCEAQRAEFEPD